MWLECTGIYWNILEYTELYLTIPDVPNFEKKWIVDLGIESCICSTKHVLSETKNRGIELFLGCPRIIFRLWNAARPTSQNVCLALAKIELVLPRLYSSQLRISDN